MPETIVRDGQRIAYTDHGGDGPVVVALHSFLMDGTMFAPQVEAWRGGLRVITVDELPKTATGKIRRFVLREVL